MARALTTMPLLTIAIPTYNRASELRTNLEILLPQVAGRCSLLVVDNCSETPASEVVASLAERFDIGGVAVVRNAVNVGGDANILRCIELPTTDWVWVLGDDDYADESAVATVLDEIARHPDAICINFPDLDADRTRDWVTRGMAEFVEGIDDFGNILFLSVNVYRRAALIDQMLTGYASIFAMTPHVGLMLNSMDEGSEVVFSRQRILAEHGYPPEPSWKPTRLAMGITSLLDFPAVRPVSRALGRKMAAMRGATFESLLEELIETRRATGYRDMLEAYDRSVPRIVRFDERPIVHLLARLYRALLVSPALAAGLHAITGPLWMRPKIRAWTVAQNRSRRENWRNATIEKVVLRISPFAPGILKKIYRKLRPGLYE